MLGRLVPRVRRYVTPQVLVIDEMGCLPLDDVGATLFFQLLTARYALITTSNKTCGDRGATQ